MSNGIVKLFAGAAMIIATPALATPKNVAYSTSPVAITSFSVNESYESGMIGGELEEAPRFIASDITLKFVNTSKVPATSVTFLVSDGQYMRTIVDKGTFTPGVPIKHNFAVGNGISALLDATCNVTQVDFPDGSAWHI